MIESTAPEKLKLGICRTSVVRSSWWQHYSLQTFANKAFNSQLLATSFLVGINLMTLNSNQQNAAWELGLHIIS